MICVSLSMLRKYFTFTLWISARVEKAEPTCLEKELFFAIYSTFSFLSVSMVKLWCATKEFLDAQQKQPQKRSWSLYCWTDLEEENLQAGNHQISENQKMTGDKRMSLVSVKNLLSFVGRKEEVRSLNITFLGSTSSTFSEINFPS